MVKNIVNQSAKVKSDVNNVKTAEIKLSTFLADHNFPFQTVDFFVRILKDILHESKIAKNVQILLRI